MALLKVDNLNSDKLKKPKNINSDKLLKLLLVGEATHFLSFLD